MSSDCTVVKPLAAGEIGTFICVEHQTDRHTIVVRNREKLTDGVWSDTWK